MGNVSLARRVDRVPGLDLLVLLAFLHNEVKQDFVPKDCLFEGSTLGLSQSDIDDLDDLVVEHIVHVILPHEGQQNWEEVSCLGNYLFATQDVFLVNKSENLNYFDPPQSALWSDPFLDL